MQRSKKNRKARGDFTVKFESVIDLAVNPIDFSIGLPKLNKTYLLYIYRTIFISADFVTFVYFSIYERTILNSCPTQGRVEG